MTTFSPYTVGSVAIRRSSCLPPTRIDMRPSCGIRFSAMFMSAMTFSRLMRPPWMFFGECMTSCRTPSTRKRTRTSFSIGSMWTSDARSPTACVMIAWTSLTIGASSTAASRLSSSPSSCDEASLTRASTCPSMCENFWIAASTSPAVATTGCTSRFVIARMSSSA